MNRIKTKSAARRRFLRDALAVSIVLLFGVASALSNSDAIARTGTKLTPKDISLAIDPHTRGIIEQLFSSDASERAEAADRLAFFGPVFSQPAIPFLIQLLSDDAEIRHGGISPTGDPLDWSNTPGDSAARALRVLGEPAIGSLLNVLASGPTSARIRAASVLGEKRDTRSHAALLGALRDRIARVRYAVVTSLDFEMPGVEPAAIGLIRDRDRLVRRVAVDRLAEHGTTLSVEPLIRALSDTDSDVRSLAIFGLQNHGDRRAIGPLISLLKSRDLKVREHAAAALNEITGEDFGLEDARWREWWRHASGGRGN